MNKKCSLSTIGQALLQHLSLLKIAGVDDDLRMHPGRKRRELLCDQIVDESAGVSIVGILKRRCPARILGLPAGCDDLKIGLFTEIGPHLCEGPEFWIANLIFFDAPKNWLVEDKAAADTK